MNEIVQHHLPHNNWRATWIWGVGEASPRNEWRLFRKQFYIDAAEPLILKLTADARYVVYINGQLLGRGPVRSWQTSLAYDEYNITHLVRIGQYNSIAVLVMHYGVSTFQYLRGRGGLLAQIDATTNTYAEQSKFSPIVTTDDSWKTTIHASYATRASRISCQLPFVEMFDANQAEVDWFARDFDDSNWDSATVIGAVGMHPWTEIVATDIPPLTETAVDPLRIERLRAVVPRQWGSAIDWRNHFVPSSPDHANVIQLYGIAATILRLTEPTTLTIGIVDSGRFTTQIAINGRWYTEQDYERKMSEQYLHIPLEAGDHFVLLDLEGTVHGHSYHLAIDAPIPIELISPLTILQNKIMATPFVTLGPFDYIEKIDHQPTKPIKDNHPEYIRAKATLKSAGDLQNFLPLLRTLDAALMSDDDIFSACVWTTEAKTISIPYTLHNLVIANRTVAEIPLFDQADTEFIVDFGKEYSGYIAFSLFAAANTIIDFYGFEYMNANWIQHTYQLDNTMRYICHEGYQTYTSNIRRGFRYLQIVVRQASYPVRFEKLTMLQSHFPVAEIGQFHSSDALLNDIWEMSKHTTKLCMEDTFVDCPSYEQVYWVGDARNEALINYYLFGNTAITKRSLELVIGSGFQSPLLVNQVPSGWNSVIPNWTFFWITACYEYYLFSGDQQFAQNVLPAMETVLDAYQQRINPQGLLDMNGWNLLDWAPIDQPNEGIVSHQNMFLVRALQHAATLANLTNQTHMPIQQWQTAAHTLQLAINHHLWSEEEQAYIDCIHEDGRRSTIYSMQTQTVAYLCNIAGEDRLHYLEQYILKPPVHFVPIGSPFMSFFYYEALVKLGQQQVMIDDIRHHYGTMLRYGATTCWEMYPKPLDVREHEQLLTRSHCHAWSAGPAYFLSAYLLGVTSDDPGWNQITIEPHIVDLDWARGTVPLPGDGRVDIEWHVDHTSRLFSLRVIIPAHIKATIITPDGYELQLDKVVID
ncbi:family 78 glycoside hydrolase catalytic domain [Paenibacillus yanchengensis]|uniref:Family 78 glycoside hydrolase catalytic domain n=1 Tax=Paenibacillus yanchengensis TaxID=2035833 RepID=A0ABW4YNR6_9BACL